MPHLRADLVNELRVVRDDDHAAIVRVDRLGHGAERIPIEVVRRLVENDDVGRVPHRRREHDLDLLSARKCAHARVRRELRREAHVVEVRLHELLRERADQLGGERCDLVVHVLEQLLETILLEFSLGHPCGEVAFPHDFVLVFLAFRCGTAALGEALEDALLHLERTIFSLVLDLDRFRDRLLFFGRELGSHLLERLLVRAILIAPADVLVWRFLQVVLDVVERVLCDVRHTCVRVLPHFA
mmetsp:Transcript_3544/g.8991  ORF Transcript_3544/g.8991 Transcript_3544/m.8991 type:complete len:242 (-) Transcript_3544:2189-2914(-)